jgi:hypothetical protein
MGVSFGSVLSRRRLPWIARRRLAGSTAKKRRRLRR